MVGHRATKFLMNHVFPEYPLVVDNIMAFDAKNRYQSVLDEMDKDIRFYAAYDILGNIGEQFFDVYRYCDKATVWRVTALYPVLRGMSEDVTLAVHEVVIELLMFFEEHKDSENFNKFHWALYYKLENMSYWSVKIVEKLMRYVVKVGYRLSSMKYKEISQQTG